MPPRDTIIKDGWSITDDPYVISYGDRFKFVDLGIEGRFIGAEREDSRIAIEIKEFRGSSAIADLEQAIGQYVLYRLLLNRVDPEREIYLAISDVTYNGIFNEPIGEVVIGDLPLQLLIVDVEKAKVKLWIPPRSGRL